MANMSVNAKWLEQWNELAEFVNFGVKLEDILEQNLEWKKKDHSLAPSIKNYAADKAWVKTFHIRQLTETKFHITVKESSISMNAKPAKPRGVCIMIELKKIKERKRWRTKYLD